MRFPWANAVLLVLLIAQFVTGYFGLISGSETYRWVLWLHGIGGFGILVVLGWKGLIILDVYQRGRGWNLRRLAFLLLLVMLLANLGAGLLWTFDGPHYVAGFSVLTIHILLAVGLIGLLGWHTFNKWFIFNQPTAWDRALFLRTLGAALGGLALWQSLRWARGMLNVAGADRRFTGSYETGSFTGVFPPTSWIADYPAPVDAETWRLRIRGEVDEPVTLTYDQLLRLGQTEGIATLDCTGGWYSHQVWRGVRVADLLKMAGVKENARSVTFEAVSGYKRRFSLTEARRYVLALEVAGGPLKHGNGFPARLVAPGKRGFEWVKWVGEIRVNDTSEDFQSPLPLM